MQGHFYFYFYNFKPQHQSLTQKNSSFFYHYYLFNNQLRISYLNYYTNPIGFK